MIDFELYYPTKLFKYVEYIQFISKKGSGNLGFKTYQNTNYCLSIFKGTSLNFDKSTHILALSENSNKSINSFFDGFHKEPIELSLQGNVDQICIVFKPLGLRYFSKISVKEITKNEDIFCAIFDKNSTFFLESLFEKHTNLERAVALENFLEAKFKSNVVEVNFEKMLHTISHKNGNLKLIELEKEFNLNRIQIYRKFENLLGQSPKNFIDTVRFRASLNHLKNSKFKSLVALAYDLGYADQSHFINSFQKFAAESPLQFIKKMKVEDNIFVYSS